MSATISITEQQMFGAVGSCVQAMLPALVVQQGIANRVAQPIGDYAILTEINRTALAMPSHTYTDAAPVETRNAMQPIQAEIQCDVYGSNSAENAQIIATLWRDMFSTEFFAAQFLPIDVLYANDPRKAPIFNAESQYEARWIVSLMLQCNITISTPMAFADKVNITPVEIDAAYPAGV